MGARPQADKCIIHAAGWLAAAGGRAPRQLILSQLCWKVGPACLRCGSSGGTSWPIKNVFS